MYKLIYILLPFVFFHTYAQQEIKEIRDYPSLDSYNEIPNIGLNQISDSATIKVIDPYYREDQFYFAITYNLLRNNPKRVSQNLFSGGLHFGFLRDMPVNKARTYSIAIGLGYSTNRIDQNLKITSTNESFIYETIPGDLSYSKNKLLTSYLELPIEFRWRTSTYYSHKFWRVYTGFKMSYLVSDRSEFKADNSREIVRGNKDLNSLIYGVYTSFGYNTWNFYGYYSLNSLFKSGSVDGQALNFRTIHLGLMFYIL